jgi:hypothetical protein
VTEDHLAGHFDDDDRAEWFARTLSDLLEADSATAGTWSVFTVSGKRGSWVWRRAMTEREKLTRLWIDHTLLPSHRARYGQAGDGDDHAQLVVSAVGAACAFGSRFSAC